MFKRQEAMKLKKDGAVEVEIVHDENGDLRRQRIVDRNLEMLHQKVEDID